jgi:hypothetical protein
LPRSSILDCNRKETITDHGSGNMLDEKDWVSKDWVSHVLLAALQTHSEICPSFP